MIPVPKRVATPISPLHHWKQAGLADADPEPPHSENLSGPVNEVAPSFETPLAMRAPRVTDRGTIFAATSRVACSCVAIVCARSGCATCCDGRT
jgi:hypothetical protein